MAAWLGAIVIGLLTYSGFYDLFSAAQAAGGTHTTAVNLALTLLDRGAVADAERILAALPDGEAGLGIIGLHGARARALAERAQWEAALAQAERQYALEASRGHVLWPRAFLRVTDVRALLGLARPEEALRLADAEVALHARRGAPGHEAMARLSRALVLSGGEARAELERAASAAPARRCRSSRRTCSPSRARRCGAPAVAPMRASRCASPATSLAASARPDSRNAPTRSSSSRAAGSSASRWQASTH